MLIIGRLIAFLGGGTFQLIAIGGLAALSWYYVTNYQARGREIARLESEATQYKDVIRALKQNVGQARDTIKAAADARQAFKADTENLCKLWVKVRESATPVDDILEALKKKDAEK